MADTLNESKICPGCGAELSYRAKPGKKVCEFCGSEYELTEKEQAQASSEQKAIDAARASVSELEQMHNSRKEQLRPVSKYFGIFMILLGLFMVGKYIWNHGTHGLASAISYAMIPVTIGAYSLYSRQDKLRRLARLK